MMCRKCFSAYERLYSLKKSENLVHAMSVLAPEDIASGSKRPRIDVPVLTANPVSTTSSKFSVVTKKSMHYYIQLF